MSCDGLTLGKIIFGYTPRVVLPPQQPVSKDGEKTFPTSNLGTLKKSSDLSSVFRFPPNSERWVSIRTDIPNEPLSIAFIFIVICNLECNGPT